MDKQALREELDKLPTTLVDKRVLVDKSAVLALVDRLEHPQKVVIPQFVADWIEEFKKTNYTIPELLSNCLTDEVDRWYYEHSELFMRAWLDGYEVEREKLYTVEIPNPNSVYPTTLMRNDEGEIVLEKCFIPDFWEKKPRYRLTKADIKKDFAWAWEAGFAKEVE